MELLGIKALSGQQCMPWGKLRGDGGCGGLLPPEQPTHHTRTSNCPFLQDAKKTTGKLLQVGEKGRSGRGQGEVFHFLWKVGGTQ